MESTKRDDQQFRRKITAKLFHQETIFDFHINNFAGIIDKTNMSFAINH